MDLILRKAEEKDLDGLDQVMLVISDKAGDRETVKKLLKKIDSDPQKYLMVAEDRDTGAICGSLFGVVFEDICDSCRPILLVENVAVLESYQGKGVGRKMFESIEAWGKNVWDCHYEILVSGMNRTGAHQFYKALGFIEAKGFKKYL